MSEKTAEHSPLPWTIEGPDDFGDYNIHQPDIKLAVGAIVSNLRTEAETAANAALIVRAVNHHAKLVEALRQIGASIEYSRERGTESGLMAQQIVREALAEIHQEPKS